MAVYISKDFTYDDMLADIESMDTSVFEVECECGEAHRLEPDGSCTCDCGEKVKSPLLRWGLI